MLFCKEYHPKSAHATDRYFFKRSVWRAETMNATYVNFRISRVPLWLATVILRHFLGGYGKRRKVDLFLGPTYLDRSIYWYDLLDRTLRNGKSSPGVERHLVKAYTFALNRWHPERSKINSEKIFGFCRPSRYIILGSRRFYLRN